MYVLTKLVEVAPETDGEIQDEPLVERIRAGEGRLFGLLYQRYRIRTYALAFGMTGDPEQAEDLTQEIFLKVFERLATFQRQAKFATWFYRIALNHCLNHCRNERRRRSSFAPNNEEGRGFAKATASEEAENSFLQKEVQRHIRSALMSLKPEIRLLLLLKEIEGLSYEEIAERLECSTGTVASRLNRGRRLLARKLESLKGKI